MATYPVKHFSSEMRGAPTVSGTAGTMIGLLDACLITGFGLVSVTSINVAAGVATATVSAGNSFDVDAIVLIAGATPAALNGEARVLTSTTTSFSFATTAVDGAASGTITAKYAPVGGWEKTYTGTNKAVYRSVDPQANGHCVRVDDSSATVARVIGYESMTNVDTGSGRFPTEAQISGGAYWIKSNAGSASARPFALFGDSRFFILSIAPGTPSATYPTPFSAFAFGDLLTHRASGDAWNTAVFTGTSNSSYGHSEGSIWRSQGSNSSSGVVLARATSGAGGSLMHAYWPDIGTTSFSASSGNDDNMGRAPSIVDGLIKTSRVRVLLTSGAEAQMTRANVPGFLYFPHSKILDALVPLSKFDLQIDGGVRRAFFVPAGALGSASSAADAGFAVDITGPWR